MNKKFFLCKNVVLLSAVTAFSFFVGCSSDSESTVAPENGNDPLSIFSDSSVNPDGNISSGSTNNGNEVNPNQQTYNSSASSQNPKNPQNPQNPNTPNQPNQPNSSPSNNQNPNAGVSSSAYVPVVPMQSSSSALKQYEDNHAPKASALPAAGFYSNLTINPPAAQQGGQVKCTFDGSIPTQNSESITAALQVTKSMVIRCSEFLNGQALDTTTQTYFINESVSMPVVALTVNHHDMFDSTDGLYATGPLTNNQGGGGMFGGMGGFADPNATDNNNPKCSEPCKQANFWKDTELPVHVEFFENGSSTKEKNWEFDAGISIIGNYSRYKPKKSVAIKMDDDTYGDKSLKYALFKTRPEAKKFRSFNLRNNGNRFWTDYIGDPMLVSLMEGTSVDYQRSRQVVVFYNGEYFGIHDMRERLNRSFAETNYGLDRKSINVVKNCGTGDAGCINGWAASGTNGASPQEFSQVVNQITSGNFEGENNQQYAQLKNSMNVSSFAQYMVAEMYIHNGDWPNNNIRAWGSPSSGIPFKFMIYDVDHGYGFHPGITGFDTQSQNMFQWVLGSATMETNQGGNQPGQQQGQQPGGPGGMGGGAWGGMGGMGGWSMGASSTIGNMLKKLLANPDFKRLFINQACILLDNFLTYDKVQAAVQSMMATIPSQEQQRDEQRWPRNQSNFNWSPSGSDLLQFGRNRTETMRQELAQYFGLSNAVDVTISASGSGSVLVDGMALPSSNYKGKFYAENAMELTAVPSSGGVFTGWSDNSTENPRIFTLNGSTTITAQFK